MHASKVTPRRTKGKRVSHGTNGPFTQYDHLVALDWSMMVMAIGHLTRSLVDPEVFELPTDLLVLKEYLKSLHGTVALTLEETTTSHWLYLELRDCVDRLVICNPYRNHLLSDGPKTDKIDAAKLVLLLRAGLLKEVFHADDALYDLRLLVSAYTDLIQAGVRFKNQRSALARGHGTESTHAAFIVEHLEKFIALYGQSRKDYVQKFAAFCRRDKDLHHLLAIHGIDIIGAVKTLALVVDARRFPRTGHFLSYCGLVRNEKFSGGRRYGKQKPQFSHTLKSVFKTAALAALKGHNPIREYYEHLLARGMSDEHARHEIARYLATVTYGVLKTKTPYDPYRWRKNSTVALRISMAG